MSPLNHKRTTSSLAPPIFNAVGNKKMESSPLCCIFKELTLLSTKKISFLKTNHNAVLACF